MVMGSHRTRCLGHSLKEGESSSEADLQEMGERRIPDHLEGQDGHCYSWASEYIGRCLRRFSTFLLRQDNRSAFWERSTFRG